MIFLARYVVSKILHSIHDMKLWPSKSNLTRFDFSRISAISYLNNIHFIEKVSVTRGLYASHAKAYIIFYFLLQSYSLKIERDHDPDQRRLVRYKNSTNRWYENNASWRGDGLRRPNISRCTSTWQWLVLRSNLTKSKKNLNNYTLLNMSDFFCNKKFDNTVFVCKILNKKKKLHSSLHALKETEMLCFILRLYVNYFDLKIFFVFSQYS